MTLLWDKVKNREWCPLIIPEIGSDSGDLIEKVTVKEGTECYPVASNAFFAFESP